MKTISGKKLVNILQQKGWYIERIKGSHYILKKEHIDFSLTIPVHKNEDLKIGMQLTIMKLAGLTEEDLI